MLDLVPPQVSDLIAELVASSTTLATRLHPATGASLANLVRIMNCYYSNLIEGHHTRPHDIELSLADDLPHDEQRPDLQIEAAAHVRVQRLIDEKYHCRETFEPTSVEFILWLHREFYRSATPNMLTLQSQSRTIRMIAGEFRQMPEHDIVVGRHLPPSSQNIPRFMAYFASQYDFSRLRQGGKLIAMAAAHHRFNYIHPFSDGNGRVSRLMSHAMGLRAEIGAHGLWSISRGLARGLEDRGEYKRMMDAADDPRQDDLDGRGNLSRRRLEAFIEWFLRVSLDQVTFMTSLFDLNGLAKRLRRLVALDPQLHEKSAAILEEVLRHGELPRGRAAAVTGLKERASRSVVAALIERGLVTSATPKSPLVLHFSTCDSADLFPRLFLGQE